MNLIIFAGESGAPGLHYASNVINIKDLASGSKASLREEDGTAKP